MRLVVLANARTHNPRPAWSRGTSTIRARERFRGMGPGVRQDDGGYVATFSRRIASELCQTSRPPQMPRAQGRPGGRCTRSSRAKGICASAKTQGTGGDHTGLPCAVVYGLWRALPGEPCRLPPSAHDALLASSAQRRAFGAPGPHAFAVREGSRTSDSTFTSTAFRTTFVTTRTSLVPARNGRVKA